MSKIITPAFFWDGLIYYFDGLLAKEGLEDRPVNIEIRNVSTMRFLVYGKYSDWIRGCFGISLESIPS